VCKVRFDSCIKFAFGHSCVKFAAPANALENRQHESLPIETLLNILRTQASASSSGHKEDFITSTTKADSVTNEPVSAYPVTTESSKSTKSVPNLTEEEAARKVWTLLEKYRPVWELVINVIEGALGGSNNGTR
jgi:hypothetical protein